MRHQTRHLHKLHKTAFSLAAITAALVFSCCAPGEGKSDSVKVTLHTPTSAEYSVTETEKGGDPTIATESDASPAEPETEEMCGTLSGKEILEYLKGETSTETDPVIESFYTPIETITQPETEETACPVTPLMAHSMYASVFLNVRKGPGISYDVLFTLDRNEKITVTGQVECSSWVRVEKNGKTGFVNSKYLRSTIQEVTTTEPTMEDEPTETVTTGTISAKADEFSETTGLIRQNCSDRRWKEAVELWKQIPLSLRQQFVSDGWQMIVTNDNFWTENGLSKCAGYTDIINHICYVRANQNRLVVTVAHEFGHYIDQANEWPGGSDEFIALWEEEKDGFTGYLSVGDGHYTQNSLEYFAQIFCQLIVAPDTASSAPKSFAFVERFLKVSP